VGRWGYCLALVILPQVALADRGSIPFKAGVTIYEPSQTALIAWNGSDELLLLQTQLRASKPTKLLEVLPLPAKPTVSKGNAKAFVQATELINARHRRRRAKPRDLSSPFHRRNGDGPPAVVREQKRIGAHDIAVVEVLRPTDFVAWVHGFLEERDLPAARLPAPLTRITERYLADGYRWFVFDVVAVKTRATPVAPIAYRFASDKLYYPLRITQLEAGKSRVRLLLITPGGIRFEKKRGVVSRGGNKRRFSCRRQVAPFALNERQLKRIDEGIAAVMASSPRAVLSQWGCFGALAAADFDLLGSVRPKPKQKPKRRSRSRRRQRARPPADLSNPF
jgi:hypothetical protein